MSLYSGEIKSLKECTNRIERKKKNQFTKKEMGMIKHALEVAFDLTADIENIIKKCERKTK